MPPTFKAEEAEDCLFEMHHRNYFITPKIREAAIKYVRWAMERLQEAECGEPLKEEQKQLVEAVMKLGVGGTVEGLNENSCILAASRTRLAGRKISRRATGANTFKVTRVQ